MLTRTILPIMKCLLPSLVLTGLLIAVSYFFVRAEELATRPSEEARETRLQSLKQLTFGGQNAEAYFSLDGGKIIFYQAAVRMRPGFQHERRWKRRETSKHGQRPDDLRLLFSRRKAVHFCFHSFGGSCLPAVAGSQQRLRLAHFSGV